MFLYYALIFFVIAIIAAAFRFAVVAAGAVSIVKILFVLFLVFAAVAIVVHTRRAP